jgi:hypothetical protein
VSAYSVLSGWYPWFKALIFALLACNAVIFYFTGTRSEALDAAAWLTLFALFEFETGQGDRFIRGRAHTVIRIVRLAAAAAVIAAAVGYVVEGDALDSLNSGLWIAVVMLLELEIRYPEFIAGHRSAFMATAIVLYSGLAAMVLAWLWRGAWLDAYDALLWLIAFMVIEINILRLPLADNATPAGDLKQNS